MMRNLKLDKWCVCREKYGIELLLEANDSEVKLHVIYTRSVRKECDPCFSDIPLIVILATSAWCSRLDVETLS